MKKYLLIFFVFVLGASVTFVYLSQKEELSKAIGETKIWTENSPLMPSSENGNAFVKIAELLKPTVVNIHTTQNVKAQAQFKGMDRDDFFRKFFEDFFEGMPNVPKDYKQQSLGSGFIISKDGYIITNHHVIDKADEIKVKLSEEAKESFDAKVIGSDIRTDIAVLKITTKTDLPVAPLGDSDKIKVAEWVLAIGHPFGYGHTVSHGIISAKERLFGDGISHPYNDYIQTDASINMGNSGGPLINTHGEVIGINVATDARAQGIIGFAIPINVAKNIIPQLIETGHAIRGFIGIQWFELTPDLVKHFKLKKGQEGVVIAEVIKGEPADLSGLKVYDVIVEFNKKTVRNPRDLLQAVAQAKVGTAASMKILREGSEKIVAITPIERKEETDRGTKRKFSPKEEKKEQKIKLGLEVDDVKNYPELKDKLNIPAGVIVTDVVSDSPAEKAGLEKGDIITEVDQKKIASTSEFTDLVSGFKKGKSYLFRVFRDDGLRLLVIKVE